MSDGEQLEMFGAPAPPRVREAAGRQTSGTGEDPTVARTLAEARMRRAERTAPVDEGVMASDLVLVRCPHHGIKHWQGIRCPRCLFHTIGPTAAVLAHGRRARRAHDDQEDAGR